MGIVDLEGNFPLSAPVFPSRPQHFDLAAIHKAELQGSLRSARPSRSDPAGTGLDGNGDGVVQGRDMHAMICNNAHHLRPTDRIGLDQVRSMW